MTSSSSNQQQQQKSKAAGLGGYLNRKTPFFFFRFDAVIFESAGCRSQFAAMDWLRFCHTDHPGDGNSPRAACARSDASLSLMRAHLMIMTQVLRRYLY